MSTENKPLASIPGRDTIYEVKPEYRWTGKVHTVSDAKTGHVFTSHRTVAEAVREAERRAGQ